MIKNLKPFYARTTNKALCDTILKHLHVAPGMFDKTKGFMVVDRAGAYPYPQGRKYLNNEWVLVFVDVVNFSLPITHIGCLEDLSGVMLTDTPRVLKEKVSDTEDLLADGYKNAKECIFNTLFVSNSKEQQMKKGIKPRGRDRLVFTYTNGATYTVRGLVSAEFDKSSMALKYRTRKTDIEGHVHEEAVTRYVTNEISTVVLEHASGWNKVLLDLRTNSDKLKVVKQPTRNKRSREEWEALEAQKAKDVAKQARIAELQKELASLSK